MVISILGPFWSLFFGPCSDLNLLPIWWAQQIILEHRQRFRAFENILGWCQLHKMSQWCDKLFTLCHSSATRKRAEAAVLLWPFFEASSPSDCTVVWNITCYCCWKRSKQIQPKCELTSSQKSKLKKHSVEEGRLVNASSPPWSGAGSPLLLKLLAPATGASTTPPPPAHQICCGAYTATLGKRELVLDKGDQTASLNWTGWHNWGCAVCRLKIKMQQN